MSSRNQPSSRKTGARSPLPSPAASGSPKTRKRSSDSLSSTPSSSRSSPKNRKLADSVKSTSKKGKKATSKKEKKSQMEPNGEEEPIELLTSKGKSATPSKRKAAGITSPKSKKTKADVTSKKRSVEILKVPGSPKKRLNAEKKDKKATKKSPPQPVALLEGLQVMETATRKTSQFAATEEPPTKTAMSTSRAPSRTSSKSFSEKSASLAGNARYKKSIVPKPALLSGGTKMSRVKRSLQFEALEEEEDEEDEEVTKEEDYEYFHTIEDEDEEDSQVGDDDETDDTEVEDDNVKEHEEDGVDGPASAWPLPLDFFICALCTSIALKLSMESLAPGSIRKLAVMIPSAPEALDLVLEWTGRSTLHVFVRNLVLFSIGSWPIRRWAHKHVSETHVPTYGLTYVIQGIVKLSFIELIIGTTCTCVSSCFCSGPGAAEQQAAILHGTLAFILQELLFDFGRMPAKIRIHRIMEGLAASVILFHDADSDMTRGIFLTISLLTILHVLQTMYAVAQLRESYRSLKWVVTAVHYAFVLFMVPYLIRHLYLKSKATAGDNDIEALMTMLASSGILVTSVALQQLN